MATPLQAKAFRSKPADHFARETAIAQLTAPAAASNSLGSSLIKKDQFVEWVRNSKDAEIIDIQY